MYAREIRGVTAEELLGTAEAYMVSRGHSPEVRTPTSLTVYSHPPFEWTWGCLFILLGGFPLIAYLLVILLVKRRATLMIQSATGSEQALVASVGGQVDVGGELWTWLESYSPS